MLFRMQAKNGQIMIADLGTGMTREEARELFMDDTGEEVEEESLYSFDAVTAQELCKWAQRGE